MHVPSHAAYGIENQNTGTLEVEENFEVVKLLVQVGLNVEPNKTE